MVTSLPLQLGIPGGPEILVILLIAVLLFGANKIPKLARSTGEAMGEFQKGRDEVEQELQEMRDGVTGEGSTADRTDSVSSETDSVSSDTSESTAVDEQADEDVEIADAEPEDETN